MQEDAHGYENEDVVHVQVSVLVNVRVRVRVLLHANVSLASAPTPVLIAARHPPQARLKRKAPGVIPELSS